MPNYSEFDDVTYPNKGWAGSKKAGIAIFDLANKHGLTSIDLANRTSEYHGTVNGHQICVTVSDRDVIADLHALRGAIQQADPETAVDLAWNDWLARAETEAGRDITNLDSAYIAHRNGVTASDYALEVVARAGEIL